MSVADRRKRRRRAETSSLQILEESFHLLRSADIRYFWIFYLGAVPFAVALLYFVADMSRSSLADRHVVPASFAMVAFYFWMRWCQARFCAGLWETVSPGQAPERAPVEKFRYAAALWCVQAFHVPLLIVGLFLAIPLGWIVAALQNASVLALTQDYGRRPFRGLVAASMRRSHDEWAQNHGILLILSVVALFTWVNVIATCVIVPSLGKSLFGVESIFTLSPVAAIMNTTFFLGTLLMTYLVISPMMKAAYVLRCFHAESRHTGADLSSRLEECRKRRKESRARESGRPARAALLALLALPLGFLSTVEAAEGETVSPERLRDGISETLEQKKYQWQLPRHATAGEEEEEAGWLARRISELTEATRDAFQAVGELIEELMEKLEEQFRPSPGPTPGANSTLFEGLSSTLSIAMIAVVGGLLIWLVLALYRKYQSAPPAEFEDGGEIGPIDLQREDIVASQLPEDEWMRLAREQIAKGDGRLAVRALFLATLANLGEREFLRIARFKSNRDYRRELERRARRRDALREAFDENTVLFERTWYGRHEADEALLDRFLENYEQIAKESREGKATGAAPAVAG